MQIVAEFTTIKAFDGERWDSLALRALGDANRQSDLIDANPQLGIDDILTGGTMVMVPVDLVIVQPSTSPAGSNVSGPGLPPWMS